MLRRSCDTALEGPPGGALSGSYVHVIGRIGTPARCTCLGDGVELVGQGLKSFGDYGRLASTIKDGGNLAMNDGMVHRGFNRSPFQQWTWPCICSAT